MDTFLQSLFTEALEAQKPGRLIREIIDEKHLRIEGQTFPLDENTPVYLIATGKASLEMGEAVRQQLSGRLAGGLVVTYLVDGSFDEDNVHFYQGSHPVPDEHSLEAGRALKEFAGSIPEGSLVINCLSGGTSSLVCLPAGEIPIDELSTVYERLNNCGATIGEINTVRKHLSEIKGGQLLRHFPPDTTLFDLLISDVPGDDPATIGSGPTTPDATTYADVRNVFLKYKIWEQLPSSVRSHIEKGVRGEVPETLKTGEDPLAVHHTFVISSARKLADGVAELAGKAGYQALVAKEAYNRDVAEVASMIAREALNVSRGEAAVRPPAAVIYYGESTVNVTGSGKGGRNQELALRGALEIEGYEDITWLSAGTDGIDGPTDAAGAIVDGTTIRKAREQGLDAEDYLNCNDAYHFHEKAGTLLRTGPTGNNLMDLQIVLIES